MNKPNIILHDETQLVDWGESRSGGPWIKLRLSDPALLDQFRGMDTATMKQTGHILHCTLAEGDIAQLAADDEPEPDSEPDAGKEHGEFWRALIAGGFFRAPEVCRAIGKEREFEDWIRMQPSVLDGRSDWDPDIGALRCEVAHIRAVSEGAGTAEKPPYFAVPLTHEQHALQHQVGYDLALRRYQPITANHERGFDWFVTRANGYRNLWASKTLAEQLVPGCKSRAEVGPGLVREWVREHNLERFLPQGLR